MARSVADRIQETGGRTSGFDYLRLVLSVSIVLWHGIVTSYGTPYEVEMWRSPVGWLMRCVLPMFFALSGFLVAGSLDRCPTLISYFGLRVLRIVPALGMEVLVSALIFGPLLTSLTLGGYFASPELHVYFLNVLGDIHFLLPGLFEHNPLPRVVNAQLWTIPFELQCYAALGALAVAGVMRKPGVLLLVVLAGQALWAFEALRRGDNGGSGGASGPVLVVAFLAGLAFYKFRHRIPWSTGLFVACAVLTLVLASLPRGAYYLPIPATYLTVYLGLLTPRRLPYLFSGDYSYGIYLYGYPIQQVFASTGPWAHHWWLNVLVCLPLTALLAVFSWHVVEKPTLGLRRHVTTVERLVMALLFRQQPAAVAAPVRGGRQ